MKKYSCFVVSPIGEKGSDVRKLADDLFELLIEPALEKFGFDVTRADKISSVSSITSDIIEHLQKADLCIIDITGHNANVMYECGRRHETGKPYIMVARDGEKLPFDITTIRTFFYDLEKPRDTLATKNSIQETVGKMIQAGFQSEGAGDSIASVVELLRRIERKLDSIPFNPSSGTSTIGPSAEVGDLIKRLGMVDAINYALSQRDPLLMDSLIPVMKKRGPKNRKNFVLAGLVQGAAIGSRVAFEELEAELPLSADYSDEERQKALGGYVSGASRLDEEERALKRFEEIYGSLAHASPSADLTVEQRAFILNQYQRLLHGLDRDDEAAQVGSRVLELAPSSIHYLYNQSLNLRNDPAAAGVLIDRLMTQLFQLPTEDIDGDHLRQATRVYAITNQVSKLADAYNLLKQVDPYLAQVVGEMEEVAKLLKTR